MAGRNEVPETPGFELESARFEGCDKVIEMSSKFSIRALFFQCVLMVAMVLSGGAAQAHSVNESYVYFEVSDETLSGRIEVNTRDLARVFAQGGQDPTPWTREDVTARAQQLFEYFDDRIVLRSGGETYPVAFTDVTFLGKLVGDNGVMVQLQFDVPGLSPTPDEISMSYDFMFSDIDPTHRGFALIESNTRTGVERNESYISLIFEPGSGEKTLYLSGEPGWDLFVGFVIQGVWHIWLGFDHLLFLITMLLSAVMISVARKWELAPDLNQALFKTIGVVTVFTLAHFVALGLATFGFVRLPAVLVEAVIAGLIVIVALGNIAPQLHVATWKVTLVFGLFHGLGYAYVLAPLGLDPGRKAIGLAAFNVGVELGQIAVVIIVFPILFVLRGLGFYRPVFLQTVSVVLIAAAIFWFIERTFDVLGPIRQTVFG